MIDRLLFILSEAFVSLKRSLGMVLLSIITTAVCLYVLGGLGLVYAGLQQGTKQLTGAMEMRVFFRMEAKPEEVKAFIAEARSIPAVAKVVLIPKDKAWEKFSKENPDIAKDIENPYPDGVKVILNDLAQGDVIADQFRKNSIVEPDNGVNYLRREQELLEQAMRLLRWIGATAGGLLLLVAGVLIFTVTRLAAMTRRLEIRIMRLVGASHTTMYLPMIIEGKVQGALGGLLAAGLLHLTYRQVMHVVGSYPSLPNLPPFPAQTAYIALVCAGAAYGVLCSTFALIRLRVKVQ